MTGPDGWELLFPFIACTSHGGRYDDDAFVAGYQTGQVDAGLATLARIGGTRASYTVRADLVRQLELVGMHHGFTRVTVIPHDEYWVRITFEAPGGGPR